MRARPQATGARTGGVVTTSSMSTFLSITIRSIILFSHVDLSTERLAHRQSRLDPMLSEAG